MSRVNKFFDNYDLGIVNFEGNDYIVTRITVKEDYNDIKTRIELIGPEGKVEMVHNRKNGRNNNEL